MCGLVLRKSVFIETHDIHNILKGVKIYLTSDPLI